MFFEWSWRLPPLMFSNGKSFVSKLRAYRQKHKQESVRRVGDGERGSWRSVQNDSNAGERNFFIYLFLRTLILAEIQFCRH